MRTLWKALILPLWLLASAAAQAQAAGGALVIIGGALQDDNAAVWERVVQLAGGQGAAIAVFGTASANPRKSAEKVVQRLRHYGAAPFVVPVAPMLAGADYRKAADDDAIAAQVRSAGGAFFAGGDQGRITQALRRADGSNTKVLDALWSMYRRGGVIAGTSAGAAIMSSTMFYQPGDVLDTLLHGVRDGAELAEGLGFIGSDVFIDQHMLVRGRFARMLPAMVKKGYRLGLGVDENTAVVVSGGLQVEVVGQTGALLIDLSSASRDASAAGFNLRNARISYLDSGDRFHLGSAAFAAGAGKAEAIGRAQPGIDQERMPAAGALFVSDILANMAVLNLMERLLDSPQRQAIGIAFQGGNGSAPARGMEFKFSKAAYTRAYRSAQGETMSILELMLDVRQIEMSQPLYR